MDTLSKTAASYSILCVDPDRSWLNILRRELKALGVREIQGTTDPKEALTMIRDSDPDLVIANHDLALVRFLRHGGASPNRQIPIIVATSELNEADISSLRDAGVNEIAAKPCSVAQLIKRIEAIAKHPRDFVETEEFVGPSRRRRESPIDGPDRRAKD